MLFKIKSNTAPLVAMLSGVMIVVCLNSTVNTNRRLGNNGFITNLKTKVTATIVSAGVLCTSFVSRHIPTKSLTAEDSPERVVSVMEAQKIALSEPFQKHLTPVEHYNVRGYDICPKFKTSNVKIDIINRVKRVILANKLFLFISGIDWVRSFFLYLHTLWIIYCYN